MHARIRLLPILILLTLPMAADVKSGDEHWDRRAEGHAGSRAAAGPIDAAIAAYRAAVDGQPSDLEARWKLLRALRFKGAYVAADQAAKRAIFEEAKSSGEEGIELVERLLRARGIASPARASESDVTKVAGTIRGAGELYYWNAVSVGEWAQVFGRMAAVRQGAAGTIRRQATIALEIDPAMEGGGPGRLLGRLHNQTPRVPLLTGWASDREAVKFLREALRLSPGDKVTMVFLAEAMVAADRRSRPDAVRLLQRVLETPDHPDFSVEHAAAQADARQLLAAWR
jgi:tetratricopeptide (TPR) repeat protein